ncbi:MAG TPA: AIPR family protein [Sedimentisphaerales bacterium]|nr:AIPR family protein [Sedimentisphaerales bacterium]
MLCADYEVRPGNEVVVVQRPSIINGCQTASTICEVYKEGKIAQNVGFVLVRLIKSKSESIARRIILASNTQIAIRDRDLISEDQIQKELESEFETLGYRYARKRGLYDWQADEKVVDLEKAAQAYLALFLAKPAEAKNKKAEIYKSYYEQIFNADITAAQLLLGHALLMRVNKKVRDLRRTADAFVRSLLGNSLFHLLPLFNEWVMKPNGVFLADFPQHGVDADMQRILQLYEQEIESVVERVKNIVRAIAKDEGEKFNAQYFFKSSDSLIKILGSEGAPKTDYVLTLDADNFQKHKDLRYYKPVAYSIDGTIYRKVAHWNVLFANLVDQYGKENGLGEGNIELIESGSRTLLVRDPSDTERRLRKKLKNGLYLFTNFESKTLCRFCFELAATMKLPLQIQLRPTRYRKEGKRKRRGRRE